MQIRAENIVEGQQRQKAPAHRQLSERNFGADGVPDFVRTTPTHFVEPQRQHGPRGRWMIERRSEDRKRLLELLLLGRPAINPFRDPLLDGKRAAHKASLERLTALPSPIGQNRAARAAGGLRTAVEEAKGHGKTPVARQAAVEQQLAMSWADAAFGEHPAGPQIAVAPCGLITSEAGKTDRS